MKKQWAKFAIVTVLYLIFLIWLESWLGLIVLPFIYDAYISKKINWQWWKDADGPVRFVMSWVDAIVFALVAVYFINLFFFQNYVIPSSSLEKSLLTGDYLFVSKMSYGPRIPQTPLTMPLTQHTMPLLECKSYIEWPQWEYRRAKGFGKVQLNDIVVFNYPAGDTICSDMRYQAQDFYMLCYTLGYNLNRRHVEIDSMSPMEQRAYYEKIYATGRQQIVDNSREFGQIDTRPADRRENYVKRCVGLPGQTLQIKDRIVYLDGKANKEPDNVQYNHIVRFRQPLPDTLVEELGISHEDMQHLRMDMSTQTITGIMPLTKKAAAELLARKDLTTAIQICPPAKSDGMIYPLNANTRWTCDNYGPLWIPAKGESIDLNMDNIAVYERPIRTYEGNDLQVKDGKIFINGKEATSYTFKMDYYWMMGDNRHNSADSRFWGFVPEDHIVGKPIFVWWSSDPDGRGVRWSRLFTFVDNIK